MKTGLWPGRRADWYWRMANAYLRVGDRCPSGLEVTWDGVLTTTPDLARDLASMTLDGKLVRARKPGGTRP